jgi:hypothetical protein
MSGITPAIASWLVSTVQARCGDAATNTVAV